VHSKIENDDACKMLTHVLFCLNLVMNKIIRKIMDFELSSRIRGHIIIYREKKCKTKTNGKRYEL